jgi:hypothetical protein
MRVMTRCKLWRRTPSDDDTFYIVVTQPPCIHIIGHHHMYLVHNKLKKRIVPIPLKISIIVYITFTKMKMYVVHCFTPAKEKVY